MVSFVMQNFFSLMKFHLFFLLFLLPKAIYQKKILLQEMSEIVLPMFSSRSFMVLNLSFMSLISKNILLIC